METVSTSHLLLGINQTVTVQASLRNYGERNHEALRVIFHADGKPVDEQQIPLGAGERRQVRFRHSFDTPGSHVIEVATDADSLKADNIFRASIPVWDKVPVLVINGAPDPEPLKGETDFLQIALQPYREGGEPDLVDLLETRIINVADFNAAAIGDTRVVVLANLSPQQRSQLTEFQTFLKDGGGLMIFGGDQLDQRWYNEQLLPYGLLPARLGEVADKRNDPAPFTRMVVQRFDHPALKIFSNPRNGDLRPPRCANGTGRWRIRITNWCGLWRGLKQGMPFCSKRSTATAACCSAPRPAMMRELIAIAAVLRPFSQRLCTYLASSVMPPRNLGVNEKAVAHFPAEQAGQEVVVTDTENEQHTLPIELRGGRGVATFEETARPGLYTLQGPKGEAIHFVVNTRRSESDLKQLTLEERRGVAAAMNADLVQDLGEYRDLDHTRRFGQEIWKPIFALVLFFLFFELWLERRMARQRVSS